MGETTWQVRIVRTGEAAVRDILAHPLNARHHSFRQEQVLTAAIRGLGVIEEVIISDRSGLLLNGHLRLKIAQAEHQPTIPAIWVDVTEAEEALILSTFDALGAMATISGKILEKTLDRVKAGRGDQLGAFLDRLRSDGGAAGHGLMDPSPAGGAIEGTAPKPAFRWGRYAFVMGRAETDKITAMMDQWVLTHGDLAGFGAFLMAPALAWLQDQQEAQDAT